MSKGGKKGQVDAVQAPGLPNAPELGIDAEGLINQQALSSILNTSGPFGSSTIEGNAQDGFTRETSLSPELQALYGKVLDPNAGDNYTQAYFDRAMSLVQPERDRQMEAEDVMLSQRGLPVGSELRSDIESASGRQRNEADERLALSSILQGEQQQNRDLSEFMQLASGVQGAQGPNINTMGAYQMDYSADVLPYMQEIQRQNLQFGADVNAANTSANNKAQIKQGLYSGAGNVAGAAVGKPPA